MCARKRLAELGLRGAYQLRFDTWCSPMHGIQFWDSVGSSGFILEVVWFLHPASSGSSLSYRHGGSASDDSYGNHINTSARVGPYGRASTSSYTVSNSISFVAHGLGRNSDAIGFDNWLRPSLPALQFSGSDLMPVDLSALYRNDIPISTYRHMRLLRALGELPHTHRLPVAAAVENQLNVSLASSTIGPYRGEFSAIYWNSQAFFCVDPGKFAAKVAYVTSLLERADMVLLGEAHGTEGGNRAWRPTVGTTAWWSAGPNTVHAGIGIFVKNAFLKQFSEPPRWTILWPGRAAVLSLKGPAGTLEVVVGYFHTGGVVQDLDQVGVHPGWVDYCSTFPRLRELMRNRISATIKPRGVALTLLGADFNWVTQDSDRRVKAHMDSTGRRDRAEESHFQSTCCQRHGLVELHQSDMTHSGSTAMSSLDRFYLNQHLVEQIDRELQVVAIERRPDLSHHRAVMVARRLPVCTGGETKPISQACYSHPDFSRRCQLNFKEKLQENPEASKLRQLGLLKEAMRETATNMARSGVCQAAATETSDKLGVTMRFIRAVENASRGTISSCLMRYPHIATLIANPYELGGNTANRLRSIKDHAVDLAREAALEQLQGAQDTMENPDAFEVTRKKKKGSRLLYCLPPGRSGSVGAVIDDRGRYLTDPQAMADYLRRHWAEVFRAKGINQPRLQAWLDEDAAEQGATAPSHEDLRHLHVRRRDVRKALRRSNNSSPGPDGIPYGAWRVLGETAVEALFGALGTLMRDDGPACMRRDYPEFNESILLFLPKKASGTTPDGMQAFEAGGGFGH